MLISPCLLPVYCNFISDIDECNTDFKSCHQKALCHNTQGSFTCSCKPGYEGDGHNCTGKILWLFKNPFKTFRLSLRGDWCHVLKSLRERKCVFNRKVYSYIILVAIFCPGRINLIFTKIVIQTQTNAWTTLTIVAKMPPAPTPKGPSTVVANQGTLEMATTVQVGSWNSCLVFR